MLKGHRKLFVLKGNRFGSPSKNKTDTLSCPMTFMASFSIIYSKQPATGQERIK